MRRQYWLAGAPLLALMLATNAAQAQQDDGWLAWQGCWRPDGESSTTRLCIVPAGAGVRIVTIADNKLQSESRLVADGQPHPLDQEGCKGTERAAWSADHQRVFVRSDLTCGTNITRKVTGIFALTSSQSWVSVQGVTSGGTTGTRIVRYVETQPGTLPEDIAASFRTNRLARETARYSAAALLDLNDVREALKQVDARVVDDWLTTVAQPFDLDGATLMRLADEGVPGSTIDVLVAVSNPDRFAITDDDDEEYRMRQPRRIVVGEPSCLAYGSYWYDPFNYRYGGYRYGCYSYGPYAGYSPWGYYGGYYGWHYAPVIVVDRDKVGAGGRVTRDGYSSGRSGAGTAKSRRDGSAPSPSSTARTGSSTGTSSSTGSVSSSGTGGDSGGGGGSGTAKKKD